MDILDIAQLKERSILNFIIFGVIAASVAGLVLGWGFSQISEADTLEDSSPFMVRSELLRGVDTSLESDTTHWPLYRNDSAQSLSSPHYEVRYPNGFLVRENAAFSEFSKPEGHCRVRAGILGKEIDFIVKKETKESVNPFIVAILELGDQWASSKRFRYFLFTDNQRGVSIEGEADARPCLIQLKNLIGTFRFR